ncbi:MAG: enoyl-CoA hydratase-related protein [Syntrophomonadaceae bacterium]|nr:enoyl-CoA hydratase-related protein [Syntrophomonadaceae bacterium]
MFDSRILTEKRDGVGTVIFGMEKEMNPTNPVTIRLIDQALNELLGDPEVKAIVLTGGDKVFAAGGDIPYMAASGVLEMEEFIADAHRVNDKIATADKPVIAAIGGFALGGGCELALACDMRIAGENAVLGMPEINIGLFPGGGGTQRLARAVGWSWARHLIYTGELISAEKAMRIGLVTQVVPVDRLQETAFKQARSIARKSPRALASAKRCIAMSEKATMDDAMMFEQKQWAILFAGQDKTEGLNAFLENRRPVYTGK